VGNLFVTWRKLQAVGAHSGSLTEEEYVTLLHHLCRNAVVAHQLVA
jgi:hypothetical protein